MSKKANFIRLLPILSPLLMCSCVATQQDTLALSRQVQILSSQVSKLEGVREKQAEQGADIDRLNQEVQRLSGDLEENQQLAKHAVERDTLDQGSLDERMARLEERVDRLYKNLNLETVPAPQTDTSQGDISEPIPMPQPKPAPAPPKTTALSEQGRYEQALAQYQEGNYADAIAGFNTIISTSPKSNLADNAQFWIGECYMGMKKYEQAIHAYQIVIQKYPQGNKTPNAMLKQALAFIETKDTVAAKIVFNNLIKKYPDSEESKIAATKLKTLN